ncbi:hypothetical protein LIER_12940 [Lithospermum erythrorhizon]|uniref:Uncharacterized protein n=1 Tax=Lithospermum erythrorhizon TaxID=34254 RepID=A0AAV3PV55_LITER
MQAPKSYKQVQHSARCLVALNRFIYRCGDRNLSFFRTLRQASREEFTWDEECAKAFEELKAYLRSPKILTRPEGKEELQLYLAVSRGAVSSVLIRKEEKIQNPIYYVSHVLHDPEENYPLIDKFGLALVTSARKLKSYFENHPIVVIMEQPLKGILSNRAQTGRLAKWAIELSEFEITFIPRIGIKAQALADFVTECTTRDLPEDIEHVPTPPERPLWTLYVDEADNPKGASVGILIQALEESWFEYALRFLSQATNNEAESEAMVTGLLLAQILGISRIVVKGGSKLVIEQIWGDCRVKNENLRKYHAKATTVVLGFDYEKPIYEEARIFSVGGEWEDWRSPTVKFLTTGELPGDKIESRKLQNRSHKFQKFQIFQGELYKASKLGPLLFCIPENKIQKTLFEVHEGDCRHYIRGKSLVLKITRAGYFWPTMMNDSLEYMKKCDSCQKMKAIPRQPVAEMTPVLCPTPFAMWGIDLVGQFVKPATKYKDVVVVVDYFSKVRVWKFKEGDLVLRLFKASKPKKQDKLNPKWEGPYKIRTVMGPGTYELEMLLGKAIKHTWHGIYVKEYYT